MEYYYKDTGEYIGTHRNIVQINPLSKHDKRDKSKPRYERFFLLVANYQENLREKYNLSLGDVGRLFMLMAHVVYREDGKMYMSAGNNKITTNRTMARVLRINEQQCKDFRSRLRKENILFKDDKGYYLATDIIIKGKMYDDEKKSISKYTVFSEIIKKLYLNVIEKNKLRSAEPFGLLMTLIPFIKQKTNNTPIRKGSNNALCLVVEREGKIEPIDYKYISKITHVKKDKVFKCMGVLNAKLKEMMGEYVFYDVMLSVAGSGFDDERYRKKFLIINPRITYSQGTDTTLYQNLLMAIERADGKELDYFELE